MKGIYTGDTFARADWMEIACIGGTYAKDIFTEGAWIKIACTETTFIIGTGNIYTYANSASIKSIGIKDDCVEDACIKDAGAIKQLEIHLQSSQILELKQYNPILEI